MVEVNVIAVAMDVVMTTEKVDVQRIDLIKRSVTVRIIKNHAILQVYSKFLPIFYYFLIDSFLHF